MNLYRNEKLLEAFDLYVREQDALLPTEEELSAITLSPEFQAKMERMLTLRKRGYYHMFGTWGRRVASILIALLVATATVTVSVKALREKVIEFFTEVFDTHTVVTFVDDSPDVPDEITFEPRKPSYIPEGYVVKNEICSSLLYNLEYHHEQTGTTILYTQERKSNSVLTINTEEAPYIKVKVRKLDGIIYVSQDKHVLVFADDTYLYKISGSVSQDELLKIAESLKIY